MARKSAACSLVFPCVDAQDSDRLQKKAACTLEVIESGAKVRVVFFAE